MSGNTQKEGIYRTAMRICRMWGVAETLDSGIPPYETPIATQSAENEKLVLQWAEEYVQLRENGEEHKESTQAGAEIVLLSFLQGNYHFLISSIK